MRLWICPALIVAILLLVGCIFVPPDGKDITAATAYNDKMFDLAGKILTALLPVLTGVALWIKSNIDKRELAANNAASAAHVAAKTEETKKEVLAAVDANTEISKTAFTEANGTNEKILALQRQLSDQPKRANSRSTDPKKETP